MSSATSLTGEESDSEEEGTSNESISTSPYLEVSFSTLPPFLKQKLELLSKQRKVGKDGRFQPKSGSSDATAVRFSKSDPVKINLTTKSSTSTTTAAETEKIESLTQKLTK